MSMKGYGRLVNLPIWRFANCFLGRQFVHLFLLWLSAIFSKITFVFFLTA